MARTAAQGDAHMEELVDQAVGMEETGRGSLSRPSLTETYHGHALLAPNTDFMTDDHSSVGGLDVVDRLTYLEQRMQMQEDELQLLKITLADVLKRLNISEEQQAAGRKTQPGVKARPASLALPSKPSSPSNPSTTSQKKSATLPPGSTGKNYTTSPTSTKSTVKSPTGSVKDTPCSSKTTRARPSSATPSCKKHQESGSKAKEPAVSVGSRRVTHCKDLSEPPHKKDWVF